MSNLIKRTGLLLVSTFMVLLLQSNFKVHAQTCPNFTCSYPSSAVPVIDGSPYEWPCILNNPAYEKVAFAHDPFNQNGVDNQWTGGSSDADVDPAVNWHWVYGNANDKVTLEMQALS